MDIRFVSSLTGDDENRLAPALLTALTALLDQFPIAYNIRIQTTDAKVFQRISPAIDRRGSAPEDPEGATLHVFPQLKF